MTKHLYLILLFCHCISQAQIVNQNYLFQNIGNDTTIQLSVGGYLDAKNSEYWNLYYTLGINGSMSYNYSNEPAKTISLSNHNTFAVEALSLITNNRGNWYEIDSLKKEIINPLSVTPKDIIIDIFNFTSENNKYWFELDQNSNNQYDLTKLLTTYGMGHCAHYASATSLIGYAANNIPTNQKIYHLNGGAHAISGISIDSSKYAAIDSDHDAYYLNYDNTSLATIDDIQADNYLFHRTKHYGKIFPFSPQMNLALLTPLINNNYTAVITDSGFNYVGKTGNSNSKCYFALRPTETISFYPRDTAVQYHQINTINYGVNPSKDDLKYSTIGNGDFVLNPIYNNTSLSTIFTNTSNLKKAANVALDTTLLKLVNNAINGEAILKMNSPFIIINGELKFTNFLNGAADTLSIVFSKDSTLWIPIYSNSGMGLNADSIILRNMIRPDSSTAINEYFIRIKLKSNSANSYFKLIKSSCLFQCSKSFIPRLQIGNNTIRIKSKTGAVPSGMELKINTQEDYSNHVPNSPTTAVFPLNNSTVDSINFTFHWNVPTDPDGNSIIDYHFQLSEFSDFRHTLSTNFDQMFWLKNYPYGIDVTNNLLPNFKPDFSNFLQNNKTYYWRVRASDNLFAWSSWSPTWSFTTQIPMTPYDAHFELTNVADSLALVWEANPSGTIPSAFKIHASNIAGGFTPVDSTSLFSTANYSKYIQDSMAYAFYRVAALDNYGNETTPTPAISFPLKNTYVLNDSINLSTLLLAVNPIGYARFILYDTAYFNLINNNLVSKQIGKTMISICRMIGTDTIYDKQVLANIFSIAPPNTSNIKNSEPVMYPISAMSVSATTSSFSMVGGYRPLVHPSSLVT